MADTVTPNRRSEIMGLVRNKDTRPELIVRRILHSLGLRFRLHRRDLPGQPDIVLPKYRCVVFVHGCFWHQHTACRKSKLPGTRARFWRTKLQGNTLRDSKNQQQLKLLGWDVLTVWECQTKREDELKEMLRSYFDDRKIAAR